MKHKSKKQKKPKEPFKFIFPNIMSKMMREVPMRTQLESSMISMALIISSVTLMAIYLLFFGEGTWWYRTLIIINLFAAFIFISSFLVTTYQQYISHMGMMGYDPQKEREEVLKRGHLFKRINLALRERKKVKIKEKADKKLATDKNMPQIVNDAISNMEKIEIEKAIKLEEINKQKETKHDNSLKGGQN